MAPRLQGAPHTDGIPSVHGLGLSTPQAMPAIQGYWEVHLSRVKLRRGRKGARDRGEVLQQLKSTWESCMLCVLSCFICVWLCATLWSVACQAPLSKGFSRQKYWSGLPCPPSEDLPDPGIKPKSLKSPALAGGFFTTTVTREDPLS